MVNSSCGKAAENITI